MATSSEIRFRIFCFQSKSSKLQREFSVFFFRRACRECIWARYNKTNVFGFSKSPSFSNSSYIYFFVGEICMEEVRGMKVWILFHSKKTRE